MVLYLYFILIALRAKQFGDNVDRQSVSGIGDISKFS